MDGVVPRSDAGWIDLTDRPDGPLLTAGGRWQIDSAGPLDRRLQALRLSDVATGRPVTVDLAGLAALDTVGAWLIQRSVAEWRARGFEVTLRNVRPAFETLLREVGKAETGACITPTEVNKLLEITISAGKATIGFGREALNLIGFFGMVVVKLLGVLIRPRRLRLISVVHHMEHTGLNAMPIIGLLSFLIGVVLAYQGADQLARFGAQVFTVNLLGVSILRELGILITAIIIAGRSGSAFTAQIGTMKVSQEIDAMQTIGLDPVEVLVLPRILALAITLPLLTFLANVLGLFGGAVMCYFVLDISFGQFVRQLQSAVPVAHFWAGMIKAPVFAFVIAMVGCFNGLKVTGSAESVGRLTTQAVVESIFLVIVLDAMFSIAFSMLGV